MEAPLFDEIGELPLPMQAQLLRAVQERTYKRVAGNTWCKTTFRLVCATNRDLLDLIGRGAFRADLYYRIAGCVCKLSPLRKSRQCARSPAGCIPVHARATGDGTITIGCVPADERPVLEPDKTAWLDLHFEGPIQRAVLFGTGTQGDRPRSRECCYSLRDR